METYYLVDYENVGSGGVSKCSGLEETDQLHIFYTDNSKKIDLDIVDDHGDAVFETHKVPAKSQSVDMHIVSYMGYLIGESGGKDINIVIVSKDKDYDNLIKFWGDKAKIVRKQKIEVKSKTSAAAQKKTTVTKKTTAEKAKTAASKTTKASAAEKSKSAEKSSTTVKKKSAATKEAAAEKTKTKSAKAVDKKEPEKEPTRAELKTKLNSEIQKVMSQNGYDNKTINNVAKLVVNHYGDENFKRDVHNELGQVYKGDDNIYQIIKKILSDYD